MNASWVRSSASATSPVMSRQSEYTRFLCCSNKVANASPSPAWARATRFGNESVTDRLVEGRSLTPAIEVTQTLMLNSSPEAGSLLAYLSLERFEVSNNEEESN